MILPAILIISLAISLLVFFLCISRITKIYWIPIMFVCNVVALALLWALSLMLLVLFVDKSKPCRKHSRLYRFYANCIIDTACQIMRVKLHVTGMEKLPKEKFLLVGNHLSLMDPVITMGLLKKYNMGFVGASDAIFRFPVVDRLLHKCFSLPIDRSSARAGVVMVNEASQIIKNQLASMGIYPEGKRNLQPENGLLPFKNGAFKIAKKANCPIVVAVIKNVEKLKSNAPFKKTHVYLDFVEVIYPEFFADKNTAEISEHVRNTLTGCLYGEAA